MLGRLNSRTLLIKHGGWSGVSCMESGDLYGESVTCLAAWHCPGIIEAITSFTLFYSFGTEKRVRPNILSTLIVRPMSKFLSYESTPCQLVQEQDWKRGNKIAGCLFTGCIFWHILTLNLKLSFGCDTGSWVLWKAAQVFILKHSFSSPPAKHCLLLFSMLQAFLIWRHYCEAQARVRQGWARDGP